ncbi:MAG: hypothetical protein HUK22_06320, partial [Thermoguttaceae bacterium]|nr:hypothetical protein [Thermoguttaceae bacterium]
ADGSETAIEGATNAYFKATDKSIGKALKVVVTASGAYAGTASASTGVVASLEITGATLSTTTPAYYETVTVSTTPAAAKNGASFQWYFVNEDGSETAIEGATNAYFKAKDDAVGKGLKVVVTTSGVYAGAVSASTDAVANPAITGAILSTTTPAYYETVTVSTTPTAAKNGASFQWYYVNADGSETAIEGATNAYFKAKDDAVGKGLKVVVVASGVYAGTVSASTSAVANPVITGASLSTTSPAYNETVYVSTTPAAAKNDASFQWYRVAEDGTETAIEGATNSYYKITSSDDFGYKLKVIATAGGFYTGNASATTQYATSAAPLVSITLSTDAPTIGELVKFTRTLGSATCTYQWYRVDPETQGMTRIEGATYGSYRATKADLGYQLKVYTWGYGNYSGSKVAQTTNAVAAANAVDSALAEMFVEEDDELFFEF